MELDVRCECRSRRAPEEVWQFVAENYFANHARWDPAVTDMQQSSPGSPGAGTLGVETRAFLGRQRADFEITTFDAPGRFALRNTSGPFELRREYAISPDGDGSRVGFTFRMRPKGAARLLFPFVRRTIAEKVRSNIARLGAVLEDAA